LENNLRKALVLKCPLRTHISFSKGLGRTSITNVRSIGKELTAENQVMYRNVEVMCMRKGE
jgi:hypothetical protein